jgi:hypothetical protein
MSRGIETGIWPVTGVTVEVGGYLSHMELKNTIYYSLIPYGAAGFALALYLAQQGLSAGQGHQDVFNANDRSHPSLPVVLSQTTLPETIFRAAPPSQAFAATGGARRDATVSLTGVSGRGAVGALTTSSADNLSIRSHQ